MKYKKWSLTEKLEILSSAEETSIVSACRKHSVSPGTFYSWKRKYDTHGEAGLKVTYDVRSKEI
jgi:putative transposase